MDAFTSAIQKYLKDSGQFEAAQFLEGCVVENRFKDVVSGMNDDFETELYDMFIYVPVNRYHKMDSMTTGIVEAINKAISEYTEASGRVAHSIQWRPYIKDEEEEKIESKAIDVIKLFNDNQYVTSKIQILKDNIDKTPHLAIGTAKELVEVCCKGILSHFNIDPDPNWELPKLVKETNKVLDFTAGASDEKLHQSVNMITGGLANIIHGLAEIRNKFGSGHGHDLDFKELDKAYTNLAVYSSIEFMVFYVKIFHSQKDKAKS